MEQQGKDETVASTTASAVAAPAQELNIWLRGLLMLLFLVALRVIEFVAFAIIIGQFFSKLITKKTNQRISDFGESLSQYAASIIRYQSFNTDERPFPFAAWPKAVCQEPKETPSSDGTPPTQPQVS